MSFSSHGRRASTSSRKSSESSIEKFQSPSAAGGGGGASSGSPHPAQAPLLNQDALSPSSSFYATAPLSRPALICAGVYLVSSWATDSLHSRFSGQTFTPALLATSSALAVAALSSVAGPVVLKRIPACSTWLTSDWLGSGTLSAPRKWSAGLGVLLALGQLAWAAGASVLSFPVIQSLPILLSIGVLFTSIFLNLPLPPFSISLSIVVAAVTFGFAVSSTRAYLTGINAASLSLVPQAAFLCLTRLQLSAHSPAAILSSATPVAALFSFGVTLAYGLIRSTPPQLVPYLEPAHSASFALLALFGAAQIISLVNLLNHVDTVLTVTLLFLPRALLTGFLSPSLWSGDLSAAWLVLWAAYSIGMMAYMWKCSSHSARSAMASPELLFDEQAEKMPSPTSTPNTQKHLRLACILALLPYLFWLCWDAPQSQFRIADDDAVAPSKPTLDVVFAYYDEPVEGIIDQITYLRSVKEVYERNPNFITYVKSDNVSLEAYKAATGVDEVYRLPNLGREGDTYLNHILRNYNATLPSARPKSYRRDAAGGFVEPRGLAHHTFFLQPHMSWHWVSKPRVPLLRPETGYLALGPYLTMNCGKDGAGNGDYWRQRDIYMMFEEKFCPPDKPQLANYAGQFVVSRQRIMNRGYNKYKYLREMLTAPLGHWIHDDATWWHYNGDQSANNPFLGHALERSWAEIMGCLDGGIADRCKDDVFDVELCQCWDRDAPQ